MGHGENPRRHWHLTLALSYSKWQSCWEMKNLFARKWNTVKDINIVMWYFFLFWCQVSKDDVPVILVGAGSILKDTSRGMKGVSKFILPPFYQVRKVQACHNMWELVCVQYHYTLAAYLSLCSVQCLCSSCVNWLRYHSFSPWLVVFCTLIKYYSLHIILFVTVIYQANPIVQAFTCFIVSIAYLVLWVDIAFL